MSRICLWAAILSLFLTLPTGHVTADEGMWMPNAIGGSLPIETLRKRGFRLSASQVWNEKGPSLRDAILQVGGEDAQGMGGGFSGFGSASFVSSKGLILTNHHVAYDALAALSTPDANYVEEGFIARESKDERPCKGMAVRWTTSIQDVTDKVLADVTAEMDYATRTKSIADAGKKVLDACKAAGTQDCTLEEMFYGNRHFLFTYDTIRDIRMVYAPPRSIGEYGGDTDNWMWPRHTGDFTYLRAFVGPKGERNTYDEKNVPFKPGSHLKLSAAGYKPGDFCFIMGYPGTTYRFRTSFSVDFWEKVNYPGQINMIEARLAETRKMADQSEEQGLKLSSFIKQLQNALKNFRGMVDGMKALNLVERRRASEKDFVEWVAADEKRKARYGHIFPELERLYGRLRAGRTPEFMQEFQATVPALRRRLVQGLADYAGKPQYDDANLTLRLTYGSIGGYTPRDAVDYRYFTSIEGVTEKHSGEDPFNCPDKLRELVAKKDWGRWEDRKLGTVPVCFLSDTDITGGNSGSAIMNGRGEMIGLAFDGNYEAMTSDFLFETDISRTINVDVRYVLWCTDKMANLDRLLQEMSIVGGVR